MRRAALAAALLAAACAAPPAPAPASLLLVTIDTLRADRVGAYGARAGATPNLDALAARGTLFEEAVASAPLTLPSHATILSGLEPLHHGVRDNGAFVFPESRETLATLLKQRGYATGAFVGAYVLDRRFGLSRGFEAYDDRIPRRTSGASVLESERPCASVVAAATAWLTSTRGPFFAWAHFYEPHAPYAGSYEAEVQRADACFEKLLQAAQARAGERLLVAAVADHGEGLGEHGEATHGLFVYQATLRVPLILAGAGVARGERRAGLARTCDLAPTLLARLGQPVPGGLDGQDLLASRAPRDAYAETFYPASFGWAPLRAFRSGRLKLVLAPRPELYDLAADPGEARDLAASRAADLERLRASLLALLRTENSSAPRANDSEVAERLRSLGYATGAGASGVEGGKDPKDALPLFQRFEDATAAEARGDSERALAALSELVRREPASAAFRRSLAAALRRAGRPAEALRALADLERLAPGDAAAWHEHALALGEAGRTDDALGAAQRATELNPLAPEPFNHLGVLLAQKGRAKEALAALDHATQLDPTNAKAWSNRGNLLRGLGRPREAEADYRRAALLDPDDADPLNGLAVIDVEAGRFDEAAARLAALLERNPRHQEARLNLAVVESQRGHRAEARELAQQVAREAHGTPIGRRAAELATALSR